MANIEETSSLACFSLKRPVVMQPPTFRGCKPLDFVVLNIATLQSIYTNIFFAMFSNESVV